MFLPQFTSWTFFSLAICVSTIFSPVPLALAGDQPVAAPGSHAVRAQLICVPTKLQLGQVAVGQAGDRLMTITNSGGTPLVVLSAKSTGAEFGLNGLDLPLTLAAGESFTFRVTFAPERSGPADGSISIVAESPKQTLTVLLSGTGKTIGQLQVTPGTIDFGDASVGSVRTQTGQLTAIGADVIVSSAAINSENFQLGGPALPVTIPAWHSVPFTITFVPRDSWSSSAILSFTSDASNSPTEQVVTARKSGPVQHKVQLSWKASTSKHIAGYNIYRGTRSGGPYKKINGSLDPTTTYADVHVVAGYKYYYVAEAVNLKGLESKYSKQVEAVIP
jgi:hypothetical protein